MDIYFLRISIVECPCMDIPASIYMWISTLVRLIEDLYIQRSWISTLISVNFLKSMHGYAMDSRTRVKGHLFLSLVFYTVYPQTRRGNRTEAQGLNPLVYCVSKKYLVAQTKPYLRES